MNDLQAKPQVTLYTREGCHLCEEAKAAMLPAIAEFDAQLRELDIDAVEELKNRFNEEVPVVFVGDALFAMFRIDPVEFRAALAKFANSSAKGA